MRTRTKNRWSFLGTCVFAVWGAGLNGWITTQLSILHFSSPDSALFLTWPFNQMLLGLALGLVTACAFIARDPQTAKRGGLVLLGITSVLFVCEARPDKTLLLGCLDDYAFSFLWALSLIALGFVLRTPKKHVQ